MDYLIQLQDIIRDDYIAQTHWIHSNILLDSFRYKRVQ